MVATVSSTVRQFLIPFARRSRDRGWRVEAAAHGAATDTTLHSSFDRLYDLPLSRSMANISALIRGTVAVSRVLTTSKPDVVHVHTPIASFVTRLAVRGIPRRRRPAIIYTAHGFHFRKGGHLLVNLLFRTVERLAGRWTDRLVVINDEDEAAARRHRVVRPHRLVRMPGIGVDTEHYSPETVTSTEAQVARAALAIDAAMPLFVSIGELSANKRHSDAIAALAAMRYGDARLVLVGEGPERSRLAALASRLAVSERVTLAGQVTDVRPILASATGFVLCSAREGLARSVMEALSMEVAVAASDARGNAELVAGSGFVVPIGDVAALATALDWLIEHPAERRIMGQTGRRRVVERYDLKRVVELHEHLYDEVMVERAREAVRAAG